MGRLCIIFCCGVAFLFANQRVDAAGCGVTLSCGGCIDPCATAVCGGYSTVVAGPSCPAGRAIDPGPMEILKIVMVPKYETVTKSVCTTEYKSEQRQRVVTVSRSVPVEEERITTETVMVPKTETKTVQYTALVPVKEERQVNVTVSVPVWTEEQESYTVRVPQLKEVPEQYTVRVPSLQDTQFTYTVCVPYPVTKSRYQTITNVVPVTRTRAIQHCVPVTRTKLVTKDYGHWENQVVEEVVGGYTVGGCGYCGGCYQGCGGCYGYGYSCGSSAPVTRTISRRVWIPNVRTEQVAVVEQRHETQHIKYTVYEQHSESIPYQCTYVAFRPETRTGTKKMVTYVPETRTRMKKVVEYHDEERTRTRKVLSYKDEVRTETYPVIRYTQEDKTKEVTYTVNVPTTKVNTHKVVRYDTVQDKKIETYTVSVPVPAVKEVKVQVCRMVPKVISTTINPCLGSSSDVSPRYHYGGGTIIHSNQSSISGGCGCY
ncbi:MAG: ferredoxin [Planctomycetota bacterium]|nr:ferredoxin [Planctomycetota bacterium]